MIQTIERVEDWLSMNTVSDALQTIIDELLIACKEEDVEQVHRICLVHIGSFVIKAERAFYIPLLLCMEDLFKKYPAYLADYYFLIGNFYHYSDEQEEAKVYFKQAISYGTLHHQQQTVIGAMSHVMSIRLMQQQSCPPSLTRAVPVLANVLSSDAQAPLNRYFNYIWQRIQAEDYEDAARMIAYIQMNPTPLVGRRKRQLLLMIGKLAEKQQRWSEAASYYKHIILETFDEQRDLDLLQAVYGWYMTGVEQGHIEHALPLYITDYMARFDEVLPAPLKSYIEQKEHGYQALRTRKDKQPFFEEMTAYYNQPELPPTCMVLVDFEKLVRHADLKQVMLTFSSYVREQFGAMEVGQCMLTNSSYLFIIQGDEAAILKEIAAILDAVDHQFHGSKANIFFSYIHSASSDGMTFFNALRYTQVYLYYEMYK